MTVLLHISDTHFGTEHAEVVEALVRLAHRHRPDLTVWSGDITQRARPTQFQAARDFMNRLGAPVLAVPGNHDIPLFNLWARLRNPYARYRSAFGRALEPVHQTADLLVLGVNTTRPWRHRDGEVSAAQIERVGKLLAAAAPAQLRVVVVHQPLAVQRADDAHHRLRGHEAALAHWTAAGADLVLSGHIHRPGVQALPGPARSLWAVQAGTAVSSRLRHGEPHSVNLLHWGASNSPGRCRVEQWNHAAEHGEFVLSHTTDLSPTR